MLQKIIPGLLILSLVGCQSFPEPEKPTAPAKPAAEKPKPQTPDGVVITPYDRPEIKRQKIVIPEQKPKSQKFDDGRNLPAFKRLMQQTQQAYAKQQFSQAEAAAVQAQRLAPQASETYLYLGMIANRKNQPARADAFALRGLSYAQSNAMKKQLWQVRLKAAQQQKNTKAIQNAQQALKGL
ncbi:tetratricopeptide repeat protein [Acinetobacter pseudolwoffii]|uniref:tetratricopeptide repeat protein n=1 Tax=Acinetobacter pseudolwoffii TaxID=2053287 RepID=UPI0025783F13|nr:tetratricopeptide repeat protein [Acinetobacter pseudolwoffii]MDM1336321.1 tetratricopeptide repeat protein [Acinetobacter pseudolwoffii]